MDRNRVAITQKIKLPRNDTESQTSLRGPIDFSTQFLAQTDKEKSVRNLRKMEYLVELLAIACYAGLLILMWYTRTKK